MDDFVVVVHDPENGVKSGVKNSLTWERWELGGKSAEEKAKRSLELHFCTRWFDVFRLNYCCTSMYKKKKTKIWLYVLNEKKNKKNPRLNLYWY